MREALRSGLLVIDGERVRPGHPLLAAAALADALPSERRAVHAALADVVDEPERYALHLALAASGHDEELAEHAAWRRRARQRAAHARRRSPSASRRCG